MATQGISESDIFQALNSLKNGNESSVPLLVDLLAGNEATSEQRSTLFSSLQAIAEGDDNLGSNASYISNFIEQGTSIDAGTNVSKLFEDALSNEGATSSLSAAAAAVHENVSTGGIEELANAVEPVDFIDSVMAWFSEHWLVSMILIPIVVVCFVIAKPRVAGRILQVLSFIICLFMMIVAFDDRLLGFGLITFELMVVITLLPKYFSITYKKAKEVFKKDNSGFNDEMEYLVPVLIQQYVRDMLILGLLIFSTGSIGEAAILSERSVAFLGDGSSQLLTGIVLLLGAGVLFVFWKPFEVVK